MHYKAIFELKTTIYFLKETVKSNLHFIYLENYLDDVIEETMKDILSNEDYNLFITIYYLLIEDEQIKNIATYSQIKNLTFELRTFHQFISEY